MSDESSGVDEPVGEESGSSNMTLEAARERLDRLLEQGFANSKPALIEALPAIGKSYGVVKWAAESGNPVTVYTERHELYNQYERWATEDFDLTAQQLPVFHNDCPTAEEQDSIILGDGVEIKRVRPNTDAEEWREKLRAKYSQGISGRELHNRATEYFDEELPCQRHGTCPYMDALEQDLSEVDILIGNFRQVFADQYREDRYLAFDEFPSESFVESFFGVQRTVTDYVSRNSDLPFDTYSEVRDYEDKNSHRYDDKYDINEWVQNHKSDRDTTPLRGSGNEIDARGPLLTEILLRFEDLDNGWQRADLGEGHIAVRNPATEEISLLTPPPTDGAEGIVALDGTPCVEKWKLLFGTDLADDAIHNEEEKREFLRDVLKIRLIQTAETTKPYRSGRSVTRAKDLAYIEAVRDREDNQPSLISSQRAIKNYGNDINSLINKTAHYNNFKGSGELGTERLGIVIGCDQPGDEEIQLWGALAGHSIVAATDTDGNRRKGVDLDFGTFGNQILADGRENEVLQAAMRFGRQEVDGERGATVYIHTAALPEWVDVERKIPTIRAWEDGGGIVSVIEAIVEREDWESTEWKTNDIADAIDTLSTHRVRDIMRETLAKEGYINWRRGGPGNAYHWSNNCLEKRGKYGIVDW